ncbi:unnamed protein product [Nyctereutes procyonoides]|uniref:U3 small nucleolar RNA-associated protein 15 homolog n=1 Tax=Nyctereutes procyonoides TaxID=34880 RepID=A0A811Y9F3_NYCPR|nr:unnamed protein product [Nyctereutes procyonoides]
MSGYKPAAIQTYPVLGEIIIQDTPYWNNYKTPVQIKEFAVSKVDFSPQPPYNYAVTASSRIHIYGWYSQEPIETFSQCKDTTYCTSFLQDGRLLVAGSKDGGVQLFDITVHMVDFIADKYHVVSRADDYTVKLWDIPNSKEIVTFKEHSDYVRCGCGSKLNTDLFVTGVISVEHGQSVERVLLFPSGGRLASARGRYVKIWYMLKGGQLLVSLKNHHKTVICLYLSSSGQRLLSGSLYKKLKVYSMTSYKVVHSFDYAASILSLELVHEDETIVVGVTNGILSVEHWKSKGKKDSLPKRRRPAYRTFIKGKKLHEAMERHFDQQAITETARIPSYMIKTPETTVSIIKELNQRGVLANALADQDEKEISRVLNFLIWNLCQPRFAPFLINAAEIIIDIYLLVIGQDLLPERTTRNLGDDDMLFATMTRKESTSVLQHTSDGFLENKKMEP